MFDEGQTDAEVISASLRSPAAFAALYQRHYGAVHRLLVAKASSEDAADLASEVFVRAFAGRHRYNSEISSARPWLYAIAANLARQRARSLRYHAQKLSRIRAMGDQTPSDPSEMVVDRAHASAQWPVLARALTELDECEAAVVGLCLIAGMSQPDAANALGIPVGTVKSRLSRARRRLRQSLHRSSRTRVPAGLPDEIENCSASDGKPCRGK